MSYFSKCKTAEELKKAFHKLATKHHPDNGGDPEIFKAINAEYRAMWEKVKNIHVNAAGETYEKETTETADDFINIINDLLNIPGVKVELCGRWLWVSGDTKPVKDQLIAAGCKWAPNKKMWSWHYPEDASKFHKKAWSMAEIRSAYGSTTYKRKDSNKISKKDDNEK